VRVPDEGEAACRGAALLALVGAGIVGSLEDSAQLHPPAEHTYHPRRETWRAVRYDRFDAAIRRLYPADNLHPTEGENR